MSPVKPGTYSGALHGPELAPIPALITYRKEEAMTDHVSEYERIFTDALDGLTEQVERIADALAGDKDTAAGCGCCTGCSHDAEDCAVCNPDPDPWADAPRLRTSEAWAAAIAESQPAHYDSGPAFDEVFHCCNGLGGHKTSCTLDDCPGCGEYGMDCTCPDPDDVDPDEALTHDPLAEILFKAWCNPEATYVWGYMARAAREHIESERGR